MKEQRGSTTVPARVRTMDHDRSGLGAAAAAVAVVGVVVRGQDARAAKKRQKARTAQEVQRWDELERASAWGRMHD